MFRRAQVEADEETGRISSLQMKFTADSGYNSYGDSTLSALDTAPNVYSADGWQLETALVQTNTAANTYARSPGGTLSVARPRQR